MRHKRLIPAVIYFVLIVMSLPAIWYSLNTPSFAFVSDMNSWCFLESFSSWSGIIGGVRNLLFYFGTGCTLFTKYIIWLPPARL